MSEATTPLTCAACGTPMKQVAGSLPQGRATCHPCRNMQARRAGEAPRGGPTCADCGSPMWRGNDTLPQGQATCLPCRRKRKSEARTAASHVPELRFCKVCERPFETKRETQVYCTPECRSKRGDWGHRRSRVASADERGYGKEHREERARWKRDVVDKGLADCCLCGDPIDPQSKWHLDHTPDRTGYRGVAHAGCNVSDGARRGITQRNREAPRRVLAKDCAGCGTAFATIYPKQAYCSKACRPARSRSL